MVLCFRIQLVLVMFSLGFRARRYGTGQNYNTAIGHEAIQGANGYNSGADHNTALGYRALKADNSGAK